MVLLVIWAQLGSPHLASPVGTPGNCSRGCRLPKAQLGWMATSHILLAVNAGCQQRAQQGLSTRALSCGLPLGFWHLPAGQLDSKRELAKNQCPKRPRLKLRRAPGDRAPEVRLHHFHCVLSTRNKPLSLPRFQERGLLTGVKPGRGGSCPNSRRGDGSQV